MIPALLNSAFGTFLFLAFSGTVVAQNICPPPSLRVLANNQDVSGSGAAFADKLTLLLSPSLACPDKARYQLRGAEITLIRGNRPVTPIRRVRPPEVDLSDWRSFARPGDRINIFIPYTKLVVVSANGKESPFVRPKTNNAHQAESETNQATYDADGIHFVWQLVRQ